MADTLKILIVDDDLTSAANIKFLLEKNGFSIDLAHCAAETFQQLKSKLPDLILLDVMLPDIPGTEICKAIKQDKQYSAIPVILMSGIRITETDRNLGFTAGAIDFLSRPFSNTELMASIRRAFSLSRELEDQMGNLLNFYCQKSY